MLLRFLKVAWGSSNIGNSGICWIFKTCCQNNLSKYHMHLLFSTWWISNKNMVCIETWTWRQRVCDLVRICLQDHIWRTCSSKEQAAWKMNEEEFKRHTEAISKNSHQQWLCLPNTDKLKSHITTHLKQRVLACVAQAHREKLTICQWADTLQPSWQSAIRWVSTLQRSWQNAAELTLCGWKMAAELTWSLSVPFHLYRKYDGGTMMVMTCHVRWEDT